MSDSESAPGNTWASFIREGRQSRGWSIDELANRAGVSRMTIIRWEGGATRFRPDTVERVAAVLEVPKQVALQAAFGADSSTLLPHPLASEVAGLLSAGSPIGDAERQMLEAMIDRIVAPYRKAMRRRP